MEHSAFASQYALTFAATTTAAVLAPTIDGLLEEIARNLEQQGCRLIGHIKALVRFEDGGYILSRLTATKYGANHEIKAEGSYLSGQLTINVIVYGLPDTQIAAITRAALAERWDALRGLSSRNQEEAADHHHHHH